MKLLVPVCLLLAMAFFAISCDKENVFNTDPDARLEFSVDTLRFDTVFTELGSATRILKLYNNYNESLNIDRIGLANGSNSKFRLNIDGIPAAERTDVTILPNDSLYIFAEVTINPDEGLSDSPFVINEDLFFETNGNEQRVVLEAWGQNAIYLPSRFHRDSIALLTCQLSELEFSDPKPYVIWGVLFIDDCTLTMPAGAKIYVHGGVSRREVDGQTEVYNSGLLVFGPNGKLNVEGTLENPVIIQGDRLEEGFAEQEGQWSGIRLQGRGNKISNAIIKNSIAGIFVDSLATLDMEQTQIYNTAGAGLIGYQARINADNCLIYNNNANSLQIIFGGDYTFDHCTFASYGVDSRSVSLSNGVCRNQLCTEAEAAPLRATFRNSILFGSRQDEISLIDFTGGERADFWNISMENCVVRTEELTQADKEGFTDFYETICNPCVNGAGQDNLFLSPSDDDYQLDTLSIASNIGQAIPEISMDLLGKPRDTRSPDVGCFEREEP